MPGSFLEGVTVSCFSQAVISRKVKQVMMHLE
jgi:hypothetical protein